MTVIEARGPGQPGADDRAVVHELVMHDQVARAHHRADGRHIRGVAANEGRGYLGADDFGDLRLQPAMQGKIAGNHAGGRDGGAVCIEGGLGGLDQVGCLLRPEIVAPGEVEVLFAVDQRLAALAGSVRAEERVLDAEQLADLLDLLDVAVGRQVGQARRLVAPVQGRVRRRPIS